MTCWIFQWRCLMGARRLFEGVKAGKWLALVAMLLAGSPCVSASEQADEAAKQINLVVQTPSADGETAAQDALLAEANRLIGQKEPEKAIAVLAPMIAAFEAKYADGKVLVFSSRTPAEGLMYMITAAADAEKRGQDGRDAVTLGPQPADAYFTKAYALIELGKVDQAKQALDKALALSPYNSNFLSEMGYLHQITKEWDAMLASYVEAETWAAVTSPDDQQKLDTARALRGQGYALIELNRLDDARSRFKKSLKLDPGSAIAKGELEYIKTLDAKAR